MNSRQRRTYRRARARRLRDYQRCVNAIVEECMGMLATVDWGNPGQYGANFTPTAPNNRV